MFPQRKRRRCKRRRLRRCLSIHSLPRAQARTAHPLPRRQPRGRGGPMRPPTSEARTEPRAVPGSRPGQSCGARCRTRRRQRLHDRGRPCGCRCTAKPKPFAEAVHDLEDPPPAPCVGNVVGADVGPFVAHAPAILIWEDNADSRGVPLGGVGTTAGPATADTPAENAHGNAQAPRVGVSR